MTSGCGQFTGIDHKLKSYNLIKTLLINQNLGGGDNSFVSPRDPMKGTFITERKKYLHHSQISPYRKS